MSLWQCAQDIMSAYVWPLQLGQVLGSPLKSGYSFTLLKGTIFGSNFLGSSWIGSSFLITIGL